MTTETLIEEGVVLESREGKAVVALVRGNNCHTCGAKPFCKPEDADKNKLSVLDPYGTSPGDTVKISVEGKTIVRASFTLYGLPLLILISSIVVGLHFFTPSPFAEGYAFLTGIFLTAIYYIGLFKIASKRNMSTFPKIIFVKRFVSQNS